MRIGHLVVALLVLAPRAPAQAAGGVHMIDDYGVETPGVCNSELFGVRLSASARKAATTLNCTTRSLPNVELGLGLTHLDDFGTRETLLGPGVKFMLVEPGSGPGLAVSGVAKFGLQTGRIESLVVNVPISFRLGESMTLNLNAGWVHVRLAERQDSAKLGVQIAAHVTRSLLLMTEGFGEIGDPLGGQAGVRWTPGDGRVDFDLALGHRIDGASDVSLAAGIIVRF